MKRWVATGILFSFFASMSVFAQAPAAPYPKSVTDLVAQAKKKITRIEMKEFKNRLDRDKPLVIDVRERDEFAAGHVPGAINIPRGVIEFRIWPYVGYPEKTDMNKQIYLYCGSGSRCYGIRTVCRYYTNRKQLIYERDKNIFTRNSFQCRLWL